MHWLQNLDFSFLVSSSNSTAGGGSSRKRDQDGHGVRVVRKLERQRKLRHLTDRDIAGVNFPEQYHQETGGESSSRSSFDRSSTRSSLSAVVPQPLPLPELSGIGHRKEGFVASNLGGDCPLPSPKETGQIRGLEERDRANRLVEGVSSNAATGSELRSPDSRRITEHNGGRSSTLLNEDPGVLQSSQDKFRGVVPTSPFSSPVRSPHRLSPGGSVLHNYLISRGNQVWSSPDMPFIDPVSGYIPPAFSGLGPYSVDNSPLHSSPVKSSQQKSPSVHVSPSRRPKLSVQISLTWGENIARVNSHPLPLPPGAALPSPSASTPQATFKQELLPMQGQWQKGKLIGRGTFGTVYVGTNRETGASCAMKEVELVADDPTSAECMKQLEQEIKVLSHLKHPNIVQYYGSEIVEDRFYIYLEYVYPGSIDKYIREHCGAITESVVRNFTRHILSGLAYLHSTNTIHRDIKGANLLVDASGVVKLADFGMAKHLTGQAADLSLKGSPYWMAPELLQAVMQKDNSSDLAFAVDIWSLGCTIIEMLNGKPPWSEFEGAAALFKVFRDTPPIPETLSAEGKDFLHCCFKRNPAERATAAMLLEHRFVKNSLQLDSPSYSKTLDVMKLLDKPLSPREQSENKLDQFHYF